MGCGLLHLCPAAGRTPGDAVLHPRIVLGCGWPHIRKDVVLGCGWPQVRSVLGCGWPQVRSVLGCGWPQVRKDVDVDGLAAPAAASEDELFVLQLIEVDVELPAGDVASVGQLGEPGPVRGIAVAGVAGHREEDEPCASRHACFPGCLTAACGEGACVDGQAPVRWSAAGGRTWMVLWTRRRCLTEMSPWLRSSESRR